MKYALIMTLTLCTVISSRGQDTVRIILTTQRADEPPTKQGQPKYKIEFKRNKNGDFVAADVRKNKKKIRLKDKVTIERDRIKKVAEWKTQDKRHFTQVDLGLDPVVLREKTRTSNYKLNFDIPTNFIVQVDSFNFARLTSSQEPFRLVEKLLQ